MSKNTINISDYKTSHVISKDSYFMLMVSGRLDSLKDLESAVINDDEVTLNFSKRVSAKTLTFALV